VLRLERGFNQERQVGGWVGGTRTRELESQAIPNELTLHPITKQCGQDRLIHHP